MTDTTEGDTASGTADRDVASNASDGDAASTAADGDAASNASNETSISFDDVARVATTVRRDPTTLLPFLVAGVVAAVVDIARVAGPVPTVGQTATEYGLLRVVFNPVPASVSAVGTAPGAWLGLEPARLAVAGGLELSAVACGVAAGVWVIRRVGRLPASDAATLPVATGRLLGYHLGVVGLFVGFGVSVDGQLGVLGIPVVIVVWHVAARTFLVPAGVVAGGVVASLRWSWRQTGGRATTLAGIVAALGLLGNLLVSLPGWLPVAVPDAAGSLVATTLVGTAHAVAVAVVDRRLTDT